MIENTLKSQDFFNKTIELSLARHGLEVSDQAKNYLSGMLAQFSEDMELHKDWMQPITFRYQQVMEQTQKLQRQQSSRELGDHCLFLVGYFYEFVARHGQGQVQYHTEIGSNAYQQAGRTPYAELANKFTDLYLVIGDLHLPTLNNEKIVELYQKWLQRGDKYYESLLLGKGVIPQRVKAGKN